MAAKSVRGDHNDPQTITDNSWFDLGTADMMNTCTSCHMGGGPFEGIVQEGGSVIPYDNASLVEEGGFDRDFYSYGGKTTTNALFATTIEAAVALSGDPAASNWAATGVMEADCMMCHIDPDHTGRLTGADGVKMDPNRPRMMIFAERNHQGDVNKISLGTPFADALANSTVRPYTDGLNRGSRPSPKNVMASDMFTVDQVGLLMTYMTTGLKDIENGTDNLGWGLVYSGSGPLPYALYAGPSIAPNAWDMGSGMLKASYCANPLGVADEMGRLGARGADMTTLFTAMAGGFGLTLEQFNGLMYNDFIYAMQIKMATGPSEADPTAWGQHLPVPYQLHAYEAGKFYSDADDFQASVRDYVRNPLIENAQGKSLDGGILYSGRVGLANSAMEFGMGLLMCKDANYTPNAAGFPDTASIVQDWQDGATFAALGTIEGLEDQTAADARVAACTPPGSPMSIGMMAAFTGNPGGMKNLFGGTVHDELPSFYDAMPTTELMGLDLNQNGAPMTYVQLIKDVDTELIADGSGYTPGHPMYVRTTNDLSTGNCDGLPVNKGWCIKTYYEYEEIVSPHLNLHSDMFGGVADADSQKWTKVCGQCHVMLKDHDNSNVEMVRKYNLGMSADFVKNGHFVNMTSDQEAAGYDVHMSEGLLGCGSCHLIQADYHGDKDPNTDLEAMHNFLKGTDTAHMVRNDLDNNIRPKNCEQCHIEQIEAPGTSADPTLAHEARFGEHTAVHMEKISCQACHIPYKKTWRFRTFDDTLGYYGNFDNGMGYDVLGSDGGMVVTGGATDATFGMMAFPAAYRISPVYGASPGYGIPHFNMVAQAVDADGSGQRPMDYVSEMVDYFHLTKSANPGTMVNGMPTNMATFDFWKYFYQMFWNMKSGTWTDVDRPGLDDPDQKTFPPLYYANGTNGYPQIVTGNPITIMTWVDAAAGDSDNDGINEMANISYGGAKIVFLREIMAAISEYYAPTNLARMMDLATGTNFGDTWADVPVDGSAYANAGVGRLILKPTISYPAGYIIYDHTGDMYPEMWSDTDVLAVKEAIAIVINLERGAVDMQAAFDLSYDNGIIIDDTNGDGGADPRIFLAAHYFSDTHGVKPAAKALGATSCYDCHGDSTTSDVGAMRTTDRLLTFIPWKPAWYNETNFENGMFIIDHEIAYLTPTDNADGVVIDPIQGHDYVAENHLSGGIQADNNNAGFVGASQADVLSYTEHLAHHFYYQNHGEEILGGAIYGVNWNRMTDEEKHRTYVPQVTNPRGNQTLKTRDWIPATIREDVTAFGYTPVTQKIKIALNNGSHQEAMAKVFIYGLHIDPDGAGPEHGAHLDEAMDGIIVKLSQASTSNYVGAMYKPLVVFQRDGAPFDEEWIEISDNNLSDEQRRAQVVRFGDNNDNRYILRAGPGRYAAVHVLDMDAAAAVVDCDGGTAGIQVTDECGTCNDDPYDDCQLACDGTWGGTDFVDECGNCITVASGLDRDPTCVADCSGIIGGGATADACGVCDTMPGNDNTTCEQDCNGNWNGNDVVDLNAPGNPCVDPGALYEQTCNGDWVANGTAVQSFDACGVCAGDDSTCSADCSGEWPYIAGTAETGPLGNQVMTHARRNPLYDSSRTFDDCGVCLSPLVTVGCAAEEAAYRTCVVGCDPVNDAYQACLNTHDKTKNTLYNQACDRDCAGKWDGGAMVDSCGLCIDTDNPDDTRTAHGSCSEDCDTELAYTDGAKLTTDLTFDAWTWVRDYNNANYGYGSKNANAAYDSAKELDACGACDTNSVNDCIQEEDGLMWQAGNAATVFAVANTVITAPVLVSDVYTIAPSDEAAAFCAALDLGGVTAWRLPTSAELMSLVGTSLQYFADVPYWTSEEYNATVNRSVDFATGTPGVNYKTEALHVRCVQ